MGYSPSASAPISSVLAPLGSLDQLTSNPALRGLGVWGKRDPYIPNPGGQPFQPGKNYRENYYGQIEPYLGAQAKTLGPQGNVFGG